MIIKMCLSSCKSLFLALIFLILGSVDAFSQCPTVTTPTQTFCDVQSPIVGNLVATNMGNGIRWYATAISTTPLSAASGLINGEDYYADDNTGTCGTRQRVDVIIYGPPIGLNFQGVCVDDPNEATIGDLVASGNDVRWYIVASGGTSLPPSTILMDNTIYYADQSNPVTGCRTSRLSVFVNVGVVPVPTGSDIQEFCFDQQPVPTVADLVASGTNNWYSTISSASPLDPSTPLMDGANYYATTVDPPCESVERFEVIVVFNTPNDPGTNGIITICETDVITTQTVDLFDGLNGTPMSGGTWTGPFPTSNGSTGTVNITSMTSAGSPYLFTYNVDSSAGCPTSSATVTIIITPPPNAGTDGSVTFCGNGSPVDLFTSLGGTPDTGGTWSPMLASGTGLFDPNVDAAGTYIYTVNGTPPCNNATATVTVTILPPPNAGTNGSVTFCGNGLPMDLFDSLGGTPDTGGTWSPALTSGTGLFDPSVDSAGTYTYTVTGTPPCNDATATVTVTITPPPNAGTDGSVTFCGNGSPVDLFTSLGGAPDTGGTWSPMLASGTGLFDPNVDVAGTYTYTVTGTPPCTDASANVTVTITPPPNPGTNGAITFCGNGSPVDLFDSLGGTPDTGGTWSPALTSGTGQFDPLVDAPGTYTYTVTGTPPCNDATATVTVTITPPPNAGTNGSVTFCGNGSPVDLFTSLGGTPDTGGTWSPMLASGTGLFDPNVDVAGTYTYTVTGTPPCTDETATVTVTITPPPNPGTNGAIILCGNGSPVDLFDSLGGTPDTGGTWSPALTSGTGLFDPSVDEAGAYTYTVTGTPPCNDATATVTVTITPPPNAGTNGSVTFCGNGSPVDLFTNLGGTPDTGGTWSPALTSGTGQFDPLVDAPGTYTYTVTGTPPCTDETATVTVTITPPPNAGTNGSVTFCGNGSQVDLFDSLGGTPDTGGTWSPALTSGNGLFDPNVDAAGAYTYTVTGTPPCNDATATVTVTITPPPNAGTDGSITFCGNGSPVDLFDSLGGTPDTGGTWSPTLASGTGLFDPLVDPVGTYTYTVTGTSCDDATATVTVTILPPPNAGTNGAVTFCENGVSIDLFDSLGGTPDTGGTWSPALASGTGLFDPNVDSAGTYTYTVTGTPPCADETATVTVTITPPPNAGTNGSVTFCGNGSPVDLFTSLGGTPDAGGTWSPALASGTGLFDPNIDAAGTYTYTVAGAGTPPCEDATAFVTVTIIPPPNAGTNGSVTFCGNGSPVDLFASLGGTPDNGGTWSPALTSGSGLFDPNVDSAGTYTYTLTGTPPCNDATATVTVTITPPPNAGTNGSVIFCGNASPVDLFDSLGGTPDNGGTWSPALASGTGFFDPAVDAATTYTYTVNGSAPCTPATATVTITITPPPNAGTDTSVTFCGNATPVDLFDSLGGTPDSGGTWSPMLASGTGFFDPAVDAATTYTYTVNGNAPCIPATATVTITITPPPNAGTDTSVSFCGNATPVDLFDNLGGTPDTGGTWSPMLASGTGFFDPAVDAATTYTYTVNGIAPCTPATATVTVTISPPPNAGTNGSITLCESGLPVNLFDSLGGTPETGGTWSPQLTSGTGIFDPLVDTATTYTYTLIGANACTATSTVSITIVLEPNAGTGGAVTFCSNGAPTNLFNSLGGTPDAGGTWSPALASGTGVFDPSIDTASSYTYEVIAITPCRGSSSATIIVTINQEPNITGAVLSVRSACLGSESFVTISNANQLADGTYTISYDLSGANTSQNNSITTDFIGGSTSFTIPETLLTNPGTTTITITQLTSVTTQCGTDVSTLTAVQFDIFDAPTPTLITDGNIFCLEDNPTIQNLTDNIVETDSITWYDATIDGNSYQPNELLIDGLTYYASLTTSNGCESLVRLAITVTLNMCQPLVLIIPDGFSPNDDGTNDDFDIVNIRQLYPNFTLEIFNRYGTILYKGNRDTPNWDGTSKEKSGFGNSVLPVGVYFYILEFNDNAREPIQGRVYLSR